MLWILLFVWTRQQSIKGNFIFLIFWINLNPNTKPYYKHILNSRQCNATPLMLKIKSRTPQSHNPSSSRIMSKKNPIEIEYNICNKTPVAKQKNKNKNKTENHLVLSPVSSIVRLRVSCFKIRLQENMVTPILAFGKRKILS